MTENEFKGFQEEMTNTLEKYKKAKDNSYNNASNWVDNNMMAISALQNKNAIIHRMVESGFSTEDVQKVSRNAYINAGLYQGKESTDEQSI